MPPGLETTLTLGLASLRGSLGEAVRERSGCASYAAGDVVVREGSPVAHVHVVQDGQLAGTVAGQHGREVEVSRYGRGDVFGEMSFLSGSPASATVTARTDCRLVSIPHAVLGEAAGAAPAIWTELGGLVAERLATVNQRLRQDALGGELWINCGPGLPHKAGLALARSCAFHLQRPVAVLQPRAMKRDATTSPGDAPGGGPWVSEVEVDGAADFVRAAREVATTHALVLVGLLVRRAWRRVPSTSSKATSRET